MTQPLIRLLGNSDGFAPSPWWLGGYERLGGRGLGWFLVEAWDVEDEVCREEGE